MADYRITCQKHLAAVITEVQRLIDGHAFDKAAYLLTDAAGALEFTAACYRLDLKLQANPDNFAEVEIEYEQLRKIAQAVAEGGTR